MTTQELIAKIRLRINSEYAHILGMDSYDWRLCAEALESLLEQQHDLDRTILTLSNDIIDLKACLRTCLNAAKGGLEDGS